MGKLRRAGVVVALAGLIVTTLTACGGSSEGPNPEPAQVPGAATHGKLTIGISFDQPGLGFKDGDTYSGFDVETAKYVAKALGVPEAGITWVQADPGNRESLLTSGEADLVLSTYTITEARKQVVDFAGPYFVAHQDLLVRRNETEITGPDHVGRQGPVLGAGHDVGGERAQLLPGAHPAQGVPAVLRLRAGAGTTARSTR